MARNLNRSRIRDTKYALVLSLLLVLFTKEFVGHAWGEGWHELFDMTGSLLVAACAVGRIYCTAFLGGHKNAQLITYGPFSVSRNPLYFFSFLGACGIALMSNHLLLMIVLPLLFIAVYFALIRREESYLLTHFGEPYAQYCREVPRFFPALGRYHAPETIATYPKYLLKGVKDGVLWFVALPFFELVEYLHEHGYIQPVFTLY